MKRAIEILSSAVQYLIGPSLALKKKRKEIMAEMDFLHPIMEEHFRKLKEHARSGDWEAYRVERLRYHNSEARWKRLITNQIQR